MAYRRLVTIVALSSIAGLGCFLAGCGGPRPHAVGDDADGRAAIGLPAGPGSATSGQPQVSSAASRADTRSGPFRFVDILPGSGVDFVHVSGMTAAKQFPTANGSGVAIFDFDGDGKLDLYFATGNCPASGPCRAVPNRLYRNLGGGQFHDVTGALGPGLPRLLPRDHASATSTTTATPTSSSATTAATRCSSTTVTRPSPTSAAPPA